MDGRKGIIILIDANNIVSANLFSLFGRVSAVGGERREDAKRRGLSATVSALDQAIWSKPDHCSGSFRLLLITHTCWVHIILAVSYLSRASEREGEHSFCKRNK